MPAKSGYKGPSRERYDELPWPSPLPIDLLQFGNFADPRPMRDFGDAIRTVPFLRHRPGYGGQAGTDHDLPQFQALRAWLPSSGPSGTKSDKSLRDENALAVSLTRIRGRGPAARLTSDYFATMVQGRRIVQGLRKQVTC